MEYLGYQGMCYWGFDHDPAAEKRQVADFDQKLICLELFIYP